MGITVYSVVISIVFYNLALIAVFILRRSPGFRAKHTVELLLFITLLGAVRLLIPIDFDAYVLRSYKVLPAIEDFLRNPLIGSLTPGKLLLLGWLIGSAVTLIRKLRIQRDFDRGLNDIDFVDRPHVLEIAAEYGGNFAVLISPQLRASYASGLLHPVIYLPDLGLSDDEWQMIFRYEITHIRSHDNWKKLFFIVVETVFWWNPLAHFSNEEISTLIELRCDAKVTADMNERERLDYAALLKKLIENAVSEHTPTTVSSIVGGNKQMRLRFEALTQSASFSSTRYIVFAILAFVFVLSYFVVLQPARFPTVDFLVDTTDNTVSVLSDNELLTGDSQIIFEDGKFQLYIDGKCIAVLYEEELPEVSENTIPIIGGE